MKKLVHAKGFRHDSETALPLQSWEGEPITPEEHNAQAPGKLVDPGVDLSTAAWLPFPLNPPDNPTLEAVEEVWGLSVIRDIPFSSWHSDATVRGLIERIASHRGIAMMNGVRQDTGDTKDILPGQDMTLPGPFVSQFLMDEVPAGPYVISRDIRPSADYGRTHKEAAAMFSMDGVNVPHKVDPSIAHAARSPRTIARLVENDFPGQHWIHAWLTLMNKFGLRAQGHADSDQNQIDWCDGGIGNLIYHLFQSIDDAMPITWTATKWAHKHIRPAPFGAYMDNAKPSDPDFKHYQELEFVKRARSINGNFLLPVASRNGEPPHGEFVTGHDTCEGVGSTLTRSFFDPNDDQPWPDHIKVGATDAPGLMTISSEALKQADNLGAGRRMLGVHWFYSSIAGRALGEAVALRHLREKGLNVPKPVWGPLWEETIERLDLSTERYQITTPQFGAVDEEE